MYTVSELPTLSHGPNCTGLKLRHDTVRRGAYATRANVKTPHVARRHAHQRVVLGVNNTIHATLRTCVHTCQINIGYISVPTFSYENRHGTCMHPTGTAHGCIEASSGSHPDAAPQRLRAPPTAPWLRTPRSRLPGHHRRLSTAAAASNAAAAAARLLLRKAAGDALTGAAAASGVRPYMATEAV